MGVRNRARVPSPGGILDSELMGFRLQWGCCLKNVFASPSLVASHCEVIRPTSESRLYPGLGTSPRKPRQVCESGLWFASSAVVAVQARLSCWHMSCADSLSFVINCDSSALAL